MGKRRKMKTRRERRERKSQIRTTNSNNNNSSIDRKIASEQQPTYFSPGDLIGSNEDLLRMILIHIPHRPLSRFKSVSKLWLSVISDPDFSLIWHTKHIPSVSALLFDSYCNYKFIPLDQREINSFGPNFDFDFDSDSFPMISDYARRRLKILQSCNGLLLLSEAYINCEFGLGVYNPTTKQLKLTPKPPGNYSDLHYTKLAFDPSKSPHYKLFSVLQVGMQREEILIYSSETDSWKVLSLHEDCLFRTIEYSDGVMFEAGVFWNGAIHWPCEEKTSSFYFDVDNECCLKMPMPPIQGGRQWRTIRYFGESGGHLHLIDYEDDFALRFDVFELEKDYSKWFVKYSVDVIALGRRINAVFWRIKRFTIISLIVNDDEVEGGEESAVLVMYASADEMFISYNLKNEELKNLCPFSIDGQDMYKLKEENWSTVYQFIRSTIRF